MSIFLNNGDHFSGCKILSRCGKGAYGVVYLAENALKQKIIIKVVGFAEHSQRELTGLRHYMQRTGTHPHLLQIFHIGEFQDGFYYTMEAADNIHGESSDYLPATLGNILRTGRIFSPEEAIRITKELLQGITAVHNVSLIHRDIKPDNIIFVNGKAKLSDPGLVIEAGIQATLAGTPGFIPPEVISKDLPATAGNDLYAIGKVFYCMITGNPPGQYPQLPETMPLEIRRQLFPVLSRMCNNNPAKRFRTAAEFYKSLPESFSPPNLPEKLLADFRDWKVLNKEKFHFCILLLLTTLLLTLFCGLYAFFIQWDKEKHLAYLEQETHFFLTLHKENKEMLSFQIQAYLPSFLPSYTTLHQLLSEDIRKKDWEKAAEKSKRLHALLQRAAEKLLPDLSEKNTSDEKLFAQAGSIHGFLATPLSSYISDKTKTSLQKKLSAIEKTLYSGYSGPRCGKDWESMQTYEYPMVFLPPGAVKMDHNGKIEKIPYHFWMCRNETSHAHFSRLLGISPQRSPHTGTPVERVLWNDILLYCWKLTLIMKDANTLPPGYIVRPPTEAEWEYAAKNAWLGNDTLPFESRAVIKENSGQRTMQPGSRRSGKLGLNDIYGNVAEIVLPLEEPAMRHSVIVRGGSFLSTYKQCQRRFSFLKYQNIPYDIGFRVVLAPGKMDFFDKHFFTGGKNQVKTHGRIFELIGENVGCFNWQRAKLISSFLYGNLAELDSKELFDLIHKKMPLTGAGWDCFAGGEKRNNKWYWCKSGKEIDFGSWIKCRAYHTGTFLSVKAKKWHAVKNQRSGIFLCQWDEKTFAGRVEKILKRKTHPLVRARFSIGDSEYMLIALPMGWYTARRFCELAGGRLAVADTKEKQALLIEKLKSFRDHRILLGGYAKRESWYWINGKKADPPAEKDKDAPIPTRNRNFIALKKGKFYNCQYSCYFLCEWQHGLPSSR